MAEAHCEPCAVGHHDHCSGIQPVGCCCTRSPRERWGTCCPNDPECEHSFLDTEELTRWMDKPILDAEAFHIDGKDSRG